MQFVTGFMYLRVMSEIVFDKRTVL